MNSYKDDQEAVLRLAREYARPTRGPLHRDAVILARALLDAHDLAQRAEAGWKRCEERPAQPEAVASIAQVLPLPPQPETVTTSTDSGEWATKAETDLLHLWCEYTGGHLGGSEFADMVCDIVTDQILEKRHRLPEPQPESSK